MNVETVKNISNRGLVDNVKERQLLIDVEFAISTFGMNIPI